MTEKACPKCQLITNENTCPRCKTTNLSDDFGGLTIIFNPKTSTIAKVMEVKEKGRYAIKVR
jgi:DNA-directed RNA polymerase subunit E"